MSKLQILSRTTAWIRNYQRLVSRSAFEDARTYLLGLQPGTQVETRAVAHLSAQLLLHEGKAWDAVQSLDQVRTIYGDHITIQIDLARAYALLGRQEELKFQIQAVQDTMELVKHLLCPATAVSTWTQLARFLEEDGKKSVATRLCEDLLERYASVLDPESEEAIRNEIVRMRSKNKNSQRGA